MRCPSCGTTAYPRLTPAVIVRVDRGDELLLAQGVRFPAAFYSVLAMKSPVRVTAVRRAHCNDCMDCYAVCPEMQVIKPALKGAARGTGPVILSPNCTNCGRCIDVCSKSVFRFGVRFDDREVAPSPAKAGGVAQVAVADRA